MLKKTIQVNLNNDLGQQQISVDNLLCGDILLRKPNK